MEYDSAAGLQVGGAQLFSPSDEVGRPSVSYGRVMSCSWLVFNREAATKQASGYIQETHLEE